MKRVFKLGILLGFIFSLCTAAQAATTACKINGVVTDSISGEAIPFVTIGIENNEGKVLSRIASDALGKFMITASTGQNYRLVVSSVGYGTKYVDISLSENEKNKDLGTIKLTESSELSEVTIVGLMVSLNRMEVGKGGEKCALDEIKDLYGFDTAAIVTMEEVVECLYNKECDGKVVIDDTLKEAIDAYYEQYGSK